MQSRMHPKYYLCPEVFAREQRKIYRKLWLFAGMKTLVGEHNRFLTRTIAGIPVVIQNLHGELHAFENICLHRSAPLQTEPTGCRPLVCRYHGWKYDATGQASHIPHCEALYKFGDAEKKSLRLREFALRSVGNLLFINLDPDPFPLEEQFSPEFLASLASSSSSYDSEVMITTWHSHFNWKLPYENLRDTNHVAYVHPRSLAPLVRFDFALSDADVRESLQPLDKTQPAALRHEIRRYSVGGAPEGSFGHPMASYEWHGNVERWRASTLSGADPRTDDAYFNWLVYPNLHIASGDGGHSFTLEHHIPVAPGRTDVEIYYVTARKKHPYATSAQVLLSSMHAGQRILKEDYDILEQIQSVLHPDAPVPTQGSYESTNRLIERWYTTLMETDHAL